MSDPIIIWISIVFLICAVVYRLIVSNTTNKYVYLRFLDHESWSSGSALRAQMEGLRRRVIEAERVISSLEKLKIEGLVEEAIGNSSVGSSVSPDGRLLQYKYRLTVAGVNRLRGMKRSNKRTVTLVVDKGRAGTSTVTRTSRANRP